MRSLQARISISTGIAVVAAIAVQASITAYWTYETAVSSAAANALSDARFQGSALKAEIEVALDTARTLAHVLAGSKSAHGSSALTRNQVLAMLQETTRRHPDFLGAYTAWEPGTFDNNDLKFAGTKGHDKTGRFLPYVVHNAKGEISVEPLTDLETQERGPTGVRKGEYYLCPKDSHAECVLDPFPYEIDGKAMMMTSLVVPILVDGRFLGITGIDIALSTVQQRVDEFSHGGRMLILSNNGRIVAVSNKPEVAGRYAAEFLPSLAKEAVNGLLHSSGESSRKGDELMAAATVSFGDTHTPWSIVMLLPYDSITRGARSMVTGISLVGIVTAVIAVSLVVFILGGSIRRVLLQIVSDLRERAVQVTAASRQIAAASRALAESASQQAAALEETSASTQEVNAKAANNSDHSRATVSLVNQSRQEINGANDKLQEMVASITQIQTSSDKISKIINTIDGLAFQTNILALNAAVEAARAGEAGLGFAVVADEVRNLAQRCTQAAHETSALIEESVAGSQEGRGKVDMVVTSISCLTEQSGKVMSLVDQVAAGSTEQARGIEHIAKAIAEMEQVTQRVAASAEECASASRDMAEQSVRVEQTVRTLEALVGARSK